MTEAADLTTLLERLAATDIQFILVGGLAAVAQGAPIATFDVDIVDRRTEVNVDRLIGFLEGIGAHHRGRPGAPLPPDRGALLGPGHSPFMTDLGPLDALDVIEEGKTFEDLLADSVEIDFSGWRLRVLSLEALVRLKRSSTLSKDKLRMPILEEMLRRK
jgi:hypothetical protein